MEAEPVVNCQSFSHHVRSDCQKLRQRLWLISWNSPLSLLSSLNLHFNQELFGETKWAIWGGSLCEKGLQAFSNRNETKQKNAPEEFFLSFLELQRFLGERAGAGCMQKLANSIFLVARTCQMVPFGIQHKTVSCEFPKQSSDGNNKENLMLQRKRREQGLIMTDAQCRRREGRKQSATAVQLILQPLTSSDPLPPCGSPTTSFIAFASQS